ncbi:hypothetical protein MLD38_037457 [Melastoma candidum]|uniref:Uncharacterized protein n=1 Tax=Melastoma candidum TaxID=119954 RepID=A0ACB9LMX2_9MYRT|nr:hypothetical protein MLD38_037457 [Melastoma candidum]
MLQPAASVGGGLIVTGISVVEASTGGGRRISSLIGGGGAGGGGGFWSSSAGSNVGLAVAVTAMAGIALAATLVYSRRGSLKSPWSRGRRKYALLPKQWRSLFGPDGKLSDGGVKFLKKVRNGGVDPSIRAEVWPFLLGVYDLNSSKEERDYVRLQNRQEYEDLRKECQKLHRLCEKNLNPKEDHGDNSKEGSNDFSQVLNSIVEDDDASSRRSCSLEKETLSSFQTKGQACYEVLQSSNTVGSDNRSKDSVLQCTNTGPAAVADIPGDHKLDTSVNNTGEHLQNNGNQDFQGEDMMVERNMEKPENQACQPISTGTDLPSGGDCVGLGKDRSLELNADKREQLVLKPTETISRGHLQENGEQDVHGRDKMAEGLTEKPDHQVLQHSWKNLLKDGDIGRPEKGADVDGETEKSGLTSEGVFVGESDTTDSDSSEEHENEQPTLVSGVIEDADLSELAEEILSTSENGNKTKAHPGEDFATWQRIIRLDALRANAEWVIFSPSQANVTEESARQLADFVGLKEYDHLEPCRIFHAARLVAILEAYALYDPEIGYCQGMSDLLSPIISVMEEDDEAFRCFVGFMKKARHNFRLDEVGIRRQLNIVSRIIKFKDSHLYSHLEMLQAEDCFFVYRMVVVLFRRELNFEQTLCLWEVMWADQAAIRAGIGKSAWGRMRLRAPPTDDLLLYAIAACVLQRRKLIIEKYSSMEEIMRECNSMAGHLDVWRLLDDAHDLVVNLHEKIQ